MPRRPGQNVRRKAAWLGFFLVALANLSVGQPDLSISIETSATTSVQEAPSNTPSSFGHPPAQDPLKQSDANQKDTQTPEYNQANEASRVYKQAVQALTSLAASTPAQSQSFYELPQNSIFSTLFPNQQGPAASAIRILYKLRQQSWIPRFLRLGLDSKGSGRKGDELSRKAVKALDLLQLAVELGSIEASRTLADMSMLPLHPLLHNITRAFEHYQLNAEETGHPHSQSMLAFFYATGYKDIVKVDQAKALLYYTFAAHGGDQGAQMAMGYRYWAGIGVNDDCIQALEWYQSAAEYAMAKFLTGPPGGRTLPLTVTRLSDLAGGVYGPGASVASTGLNAHKSVIKAATARQAGETWEDILEYYMFNADRGELDFAYRLGKIFYHGSIYMLHGGISSGAEGVGNVPRDLPRARHYFLRIARTIWPRDHPLSPNKDKEKEKDKDDTSVGYAAVSAGYLGRMYLRGEGVKQDYGLAKMWFERGAEHGDRESHNGLGIIWRDGLTGKKDINKALRAFIFAAGQDLAEAQVNLGKYHYGRGEIKVAATYFESAVRHGSPFEAFYYLAEIHRIQAQNPTSETNVIAGSCSMATSFYKMVAERGVWANDLVRDGEENWKEGTEFGKELAVLRWWIAAERGNEAAQNNLAFLWDQDKSILRFTSWAPSTPSNETARLALTQWTRSAAQRNVDALVKVGDYYFQGLGVPNITDSERWEKAAAYYQSAADTQMSAMAMWNLGWMYENGIGVPRDFYLAKRHYDMALNTNSEAYLPVTLSLIKLHIRSIWHTLMGGKDGLTIWQTEDTGPDPRELDSEETEGVEGGTLQRDDLIDGGDDGNWYMGRAREEHNKRLRGSAQRRGEEDEDPIQWARARRNAENDRDSDFGPEDYFDGAVRGGRREEGDPEDEFKETMLLVFLCLTVSLLIWMRGRWVERQRRERDATQQNGGAAPNNNGGLFPPVGDPARDEWAVLR